MQHVQRNLSSPKATLRYGSIADTMKILKTEKKGKHLNTLEKYHIYKTSKEGLQMNDTYIDTHNPIFEMIREINDRQRQKHIKKRRTSPTQ
jgi:hypothetical protein